MALDHGETLANLAITFSIYICFDLAARSSQTLAATSQVKFPTVLPNLSVSLGYPIGEYNGLVAKSSSKIRLAQLVRPNQIGTYQFLSGRSQSQLRLQAQALIGNDKEMDWLSIIVIAADQSESSPKIDAVFECFSLSRYSIFLYHTNSNSNHNNWYQISKANWIIGKPWLGLTSIQLTCRSLRASHSTRRSTFALG